MKLHLALFTPRSISIQIWCLTSTVLALGRLWISASRRSASILRLYESLRNNKSEEINQLSIKTLLINASVKLIVSERILSANFFIFNQFHWKLHKSQNSSIPHSLFPEPYFPEFSFNWFSRLSNKLNSRNIVNSRFPKIHSPQTQQLIFSKQKIIVTHSYSSFNLSSRLSSTVISPELSMPMAMQRS